MGKAVLISIRPKWCELIANGKKTVEVRKTRPKLEPPFKCYIYCTKPSYEQEDFIVLDAGTEQARAFYGGEKVIAEFMCRTIEEFDSAWSEYAYAVAPPGSVMPMHEETALRIMTEKGCLTHDDIMAYFGDEDYKASFWHISDLVIYDEPKKLNDFWKWTDGIKDIRPCENGRPCEYEIYDYSEDCQACAIDFDGENCPFLRITRPPQNWCYVEQEG